MDTMDVDSPDVFGGTKRKAEDALKSSRPSRRIKALDPDVVNKIAAGEIIVAPVHALKELIENAVDAGSTALEILVKDGGLKLLQITDNGCGIEKDDLSILCERHTTSKITSFEDLSSINTYGFRGEALASISHIAHLTVTTKTKDSPLAWRAHFLDGRMAPPKPGQSAEPKGVAGRPGTQITVEDLFFNIPTRRKAFRSHADEFNKIIDMVGRYAVHCKGVGFTCKKAGEASNTLSVQSQASTTDRIRQIYGSSVANELVEFFVSEDRWGFKAHMLATNANFHVKKTTFLLFINGRSVDSSNVKKSLEQTYVNFLPRAGHPFIYLSLEIDPARVDVNVHPTKREVHFLNEDEIVLAICTELETQLANVDTSRTYKTQTLLPGARPPPEPMDEGETPPTFIISGKKKRDPVRTDPNVRKITSMLSYRDSGGGSREGAQGELDQCLAVEEKFQYEMNDRETTVCKLKSIKELRGEVRNDRHDKLMEKLAKHTFIGIVDDRRRLAAIQCGKLLHLVDYGYLCFEYIYQLGLSHFGNFGIIRFSPALELRELLRTAVQSEKEALGASNDDFPMDVIIEKVAHQLIERREMLQEYFSLEISPSGELVSLPLMIENYSPPLSKLPRFLLRLGPNVSWDEEKACFQTFLRELAIFYAPEQLPPPPVPGDEQSEPDVPQEVITRRRYVRWAVEHVFFPAFRKQLVATTATYNAAIYTLPKLNEMIQMFGRSGC